MHDLIDQAIKHALEGNWEAAISTNTLILEQDPNNIATLNRLAKAYGESGDQESAKKTYTQVLKLDKYNAIANKGIRLIPNHKSHSVVLIQEDFIETPGITKIIPLIKIASRDKLCALTPKQKADLVIKGKLVAVTTNGTTIGCLPDDISFKLNKLIAKGYEYICCIKSITDNSATIFIREKKRPNRAGYAATFSKTLTYSKLKK